MTRAASTACLSAVLFFFWTATAHAVGQRGMASQPQERSVAQFARDLVSADKPTRTYAGRVLRRRVKRARRLATRRRGDPVQIDTARQALTDYDQLVAPKCIRQLGASGVTRSCIAILQILETTQALPALEQLVLEQTAEPLKRRTRRAIQVIRQQETSP